MLSQSLIRWLDRYPGALLCFLLTVVRKLTDPLRRGTEPAAEPRKILFLKLIEQGATVLAYDAGVFSIDESLAYADLAEPRFEGQLCLSSSANPMNQAVVAMLIHEQGARPAELIVRGWMKNLAMPVLESDSQVLAAIATGKCSIGIVSNDATTGFDLSVHTPAPAFADIDGIGIGRHAKNPAGAAALVEWLLATLPATHFDGHEKVTQQNVGLVAWYQQDVTKLAERARYR